MSFTKNPNFFFHCRLEGLLSKVLNSSLAHLTGELWSCKMAWNQHFKYDILVYRHQTC